MLTDGKGLASGSLSVSLPASDASPAGDADAPVEELCRRALAAPLGVPDLLQCVVPGDKVLLAVDPETPYAAELMVAVRDYLRSVPSEGVEVTLLLPADVSGHNWNGLRSHLPPDFEQQTPVTIHDPADRTRISYLANSASGERVYVNRLLVDADMIIPIGIICFDEQYGYRGTASGLFPAFSDAETQAGEQKTGHPELQPDQPHPLRELVDEIGWLLGLQFAVQVVPGPANSVTVLAGLPDAVMIRGRELTNEFWRISLNEAVDGVVASVPAGPFAWKNFGKAVEQACRIIRAGGRIVVVADLDVPEGPGASLLRRTQEPEELIKPLRREPVIDSAEMIQLILALRKARVYLLSRMAPEVVEELGMFPVSDASEFRRLVTAMSQCQVIPNANYAWCEIAGRPLGSRSDALSRS